MAAIKYYDPVTQTWETVQSGYNGLDGPAGPEGPAGPGVPTGGATGELLAKVSATDYDTEWVAAPTGASGTFTTADSKTVTVVDGLITDIV